MANENCNTGGVFVAFLAGGLIGAGLALLYAPVAGQEARVKITDVVEDMKKKTEGWGVDIKKNARLRGRHRPEAAAPCGFRGRGFSLPLRTPWHTASLKRF
jgi:hypothetical protein